MKTKSTIRTSIASIPLALLALIAFCVGCETGNTYRGPVVNSSFPSGTSSIQSPAPAPAFDPAAPPKHYSDGEAIPDVGWAIGDIYVDSDGIGYGGPSSGISYRGGARAMLIPYERYRLVRPGSPTTQSGVNRQRQSEADSAAILRRLEQNRLKEQNGTNSP